MKTFLGIILVLFIGQSEGHGCSTSCCYSPVKFYCCQCESQQTNIPSAVTIPQQVQPTQPSIITVTGGSSTNVVTSNVVNDVKLNNDITLENQIHNVNKISNPISIHQTNINSISNTAVTRKPMPLSSSLMPIIRTTTESSVTTTEKECEIEECPTCEQKCEPKQKCCPRVPPCKIQQCEPRQEQCCTPATTCRTQECTRTCTQCPQPRQEQCCTVIRPCNYQGCQHTTQTCGHQCVAPIVYIPYNPCPSYGCPKRSYWGYTRCAQNSCNYVRQDCSNCYHNFYMQYSTFIRCYGCFSYGGQYGGGYVY